MHIRQRLHIRKPIHVGRSWRRPALAATAAAVATLGVGLFAALPGQADPPVTGPGPCIPGDCPDPFPAVNNGPFAGRDAAINIFAGGDYDVTGSAAEAEGHLVVLGDFTQNKLPPAGGNYNVGIAGVGSRVPPPEGSDFLTVGGDVTVTPGQRLLADGGVVRYAGTASGTVTGTLQHDPDTVAPYADIRLGLETASDCYDTTAATGTVGTEADRLVFTGDGQSSLQVFTVPTEYTTAGAGPWFVQFTGIPDTATVLVNVPGTDPVLNVNNGDLADNDPWNQLRERLLWNVPDANTLAFRGGGNFQGSVLVGNADSISSVTLPSINGRFFTAGSIVHGAAGNTTGSEFHAYPFDGTLPTCGSPSPSTSASASNTPTASASPSTSPSGSASPSASPSTSPSTSPSPSTSVSPSTSPSPTTSVGPSTSPSTSPSVGPTPTGGYHSG